MTAVLVDSQRQGASALVATRGASKLRASGLNGDKLRIIIFADGEAPLSIELEEDQEIELGEKCVYVQAEHLIASEGRVFVDLVR